MYKLYKELIVAEISHLLILLITSIMVMNDSTNAVGYATFGLIAACAICAIFNRSYKEAAKSIEMFMTRKEAPKNNANNIKYSNNSIEPFVERLCEIVRPYLATDKEAFSFEETIEKNLSSFCANNWRRAFGKIEKNYYIVVYTSAQRLNVGEAAYCGNGEWQIFSGTEEELEPPLTVIAFSDKLIQKGEKNGENK